MNPQITSVELKIKMIRESLRCFRFGLISLLPVIGLPFAVSALVAAGKVRSSEVSHWNAARQYRRWGVTLAACSLIFWSGFLIIFIFEATHPSGY